MTKPGERVGAICGGVDGGVKFFGYGIYQSDEVMPVGTPTPFGPAEVDHPPNPKIVLDDGGVVWGCQCWWGPEEQIKKKLEGQTLIPVPPPAIEFTRVDGVCVAYKEGNDDHHT